jgi:SAM-dependent methyltransferase
VEESVDQFLKMVGYAVRGVADTCKVSIGDSPGWDIDVNARPIQARPSGSGTPQLHLRFEPADVQQITSGIDYRTVENWFATGRIGSFGDEATLDRLKRRMEAGGASSWLYSEMSDWLRDPRFVFMNHGFMELEGDGSFAWLKDEDRLWRYSVNLVRHAVGDLDLTSKRIIDIGCGRGGACSYLVRYHAPSEVHGIDLSPDNIGFCKDVHHFDNVVFREGDAQNLPYDDNSFDVVVNIQSSYCYPDLGRFYREVARVLRPGGVFCYADNMHPDQAAEADRLLAGMGATVMWSRDITREVSRGIELNDELLAEVRASLLNEEIGNEAYVNEFVGHLRASQSPYSGGQRVYNSSQIRFDSTATALR